MANQDLEDIKHLQNPEHLLLTETSIIPNVNNFNKWLHISHNCSEPDSQITDSNSETGGHGKCRGVIFLGGIVCFLHRLYKGWSLNIRGWF